MLTRGRFMKLIDVPAIEAAIARADERTSAELRVSVAPFFWGSVRRTAELAFERLGMAATRERNAVLLFVVPARRSFAVIGDVGIHARHGADFGGEVGERLRAAFREGRYTEGLIAGIEVLGERLARDFPADATHNPTSCRTRSSAGNADARRAQSAGELMESRFRPHVSRRNDRADS